MAQQNYQIENSAIWKDITRIIYAKNNPTFLNIVATIHTELEDYSPLVVRNLDIIRNYDTQIGDAVTAEFDLSFGDYVLRFYPFIQNLELTITQQAMLAGKKTKPVRQRYKMVFLPMENQQVNLSEFQAMDKNTLDKLQIVRVKVQLLSRILEPLRIKFTSGVYMQVKPETLLKTVLTTEGANVLVDGKRALDGVDIYPPDNTELQTHVVIPTGTLTVSLPTYLQEKVNGVYAAGLGSYLQSYNNKNIFFIYPLYNTDRYKNDTTHSAKAVFYFMPAYRYGGIDKTYMVDGNLVNIVCTSDKNFTDDGETRYMDEGVGFMQADARAFMQKPVVVTEKGPYGNPARLNNLVANKNRSDGLNFTPPTDKKISSNHFAQYSEIAKRNVSTFQVTWEHSDESLIYPGMPCEMVYLDNGKRKSVTGIIAKSHTFIQKSNTGLVTNIYTKRTVLLIYSSRAPKVTVVDPRHKATGSPTVGYTNIAA